MGLPLVYHENWGASTRGWRFHEVSPCFPTMGWVKG